MAQSVRVIGLGSIYDSDDAEKFELEPRWWDAGEVLRLCPMKPDPRSQYQDYWKDITQEEAWNLHEHFKPRALDWQQETMLPALERGLRLPHFLAFRVEVFEWDSGL